MEFLNLPSQVTRTDEYADAEPVQRATWFSLLCYCASMENSGRIKDCRGWKSRKWEQMTGVTQEEVMSTCSLYSWDGNDLVVCFYPLDAERKVQSRSTAGRLGGLKSGLTRAARSKNEAPENLLQATENTVANASSKLDEAIEAENKPSDFCPNETEGKEREGNRTERKGREGNETGGSPEPAKPADSLPEPLKYQQIINTLNPTWAKLRAWSAEDEFALTENMENLRQLSRKDWLILAWFFHWAAGPLNTQSRDPEKVTSRRHTFLADLPSYLTRAVARWKAAGCPVLERALPANTEAPKPSAVVEQPEFKTPAEAAAYFRSLLPES